MNWTQISKDLIRETKLKSLRAQDPARRKTLLATKKAEDLWMDTFYLK